MGMQFTMNSLEERKIREMINIDAQFLSLFEPVTVQYYEACILLLKEIDDLRSEMEQLGIREFKF